MKHQISVQISSRSDGEVDASEKWERIELHYEGSERIDPERVAFKEYKLREYVTCKDVAAVVVRSVVLPPCFLSFIKKRVNKIRDERVLPELFEQAEKEIDRRIRHKC